MSFLSQVPGIELWEAATTDALARLLTQTFEGEKPYGIVAIRYPSGGDNARILDFVSQSTIQSPCLGVTVDFDVEKPPKTLVVTYGRMTASVLDAAEQSGESVGVVLLERLQPQGDIVDLLAQACKRGVEKIVFCEEGIRSGSIGTGLSAALCEALAPSCVPAIRILAIEQDFPQGERGKTIRESAGLGVANIIEAIRT